MRIPATGVKQELKKVHGLKTMFKASDRVLITIFENPDPDAIASSAALKTLLKSIGTGVNPDHYNGASLIGLRGIVVKSHGNATKEAFLSAIRQAVREVERQVPAKIKDRLEHVLIDKA